MSDASPISAVLSTPPRRVRRRTVNLSIERSLQLQLPFAFLLVTCAVGVGLVAYARAAYSKLFQALQQAAEAPALEELLRAQTSDFLWVAAAVAVAYGVIVSFMTLVWCHRVMGPVVAFRRMLAALLAGDPNARVRLRRGSAFGELADDLNALAERIAEKDAGR